MFQYGRKPDQRQHSMEPERQPRRRRRPALSCLECRRRKIKCDRNEPCTHCVSAKIQCTYKFYADPPVDQRQPTEGSSALRPTLSPLAVTPSSASAHAVRNVSDRPTPVPENFVHPWGPRATAAASPQQPRDDNLHATSRSDNRPQLASNESPDLQDLLQRIKKLEGSAANNPLNALSETTQDILARQSGLRDSQTMLDKSRIVRWSHWMGTAPEFHLIGECYTEVLGHAKAFSQDAETENLISQIGDGLQKCKTIAKRIKLSRPSRCLSWREFGLSAPSREVADVMVNLYFRSFESTHRILHVTTFWAEYQRYWTDPERGTATPTDIRLKILLVIAIGSSLSEYGDSDTGFRSMVHQWIYTAQAWLSGPLEKDRLNIAGLQIHCLTILARLTFSIGADLVWMSMGSLVHRAMQMGLHRDPKHLPEMSVLQAELRRRLWATIVEMIIQSSLDSAMPPRISFDDFDTEPPSNNNDDEILEDTVVLQPHPKNTCTSTSLQILLLDSWPTRLRILQLLNGLHSELSYVDVLALTTQMTEAFQACNSFMQANSTTANDNTNRDTSSGSSSSSNSSSSGITPFHRNLLDYLLRRFMIVLHCPFVSKARTNPLFYYSLKCSLDSALALISPEPDAGFSHLMTIGGGLFREGLWYAQTAITLELLAEIEAQRLDGTLLRKISSPYRELLKQATRDIIALSVERIRRGETNIKSHMFLNMVLAQAEAIEAGVSYRLNMARAAVDSLEFCYALLETRVGQYNTTGTGSGSTGFPSPNDNYNANATGQGRLASTSTSLGGFGYQDDYGLDFDLDLEFFLPDAGFT
ncbi:hypothetical protein LTR99_004995 [Exophiala xenobiotica]|uniref:Zn(2)-C6 fungal-type domain-containing protein n=1 Tax=Vermiconidia calcicola TaxID=1690605 RepID=A0AAV9PRP6_9PEZI|nr:hypothetical protein LTR92_003750 [Exophiala xenobiotica]KAK5528253.1 hypothetical protein LTR25_010560 [Vermiconidia calcicola]KAK5534143.1 hypothetical protein LTR23_008936 [Chaetothyriales sp. CCFEE 6169]KAK5270553.1 hypothetical protein LTR96_003830 [Exophiala xenobiotica]KAK5303234.1 hypothetical protein LTR99_004995 [Exophiala xenobiotica]